MHSINPQTIIIVTMPLRDFTNKSDIIIRISSISSWNLNFIKNLCKTKGKLRDNTTEKPEGLSNVADARYKLLVDNIFSFCIANIAIITTEKNSITTKTALNSNDRLQNTSNRIILVITDIIQIGRICQIRKTKYKRKIMT